MSTVTIGWGSHLARKSYIHVNYPWGACQAWAVETFGTRRKAKKWATEQARRAERLISRFGEIGARLALAGPVLSNRGADWLVDIEVNGEIWKQISCATIEDAWREFTRHQSAILAIIQKDGIDAARAAYSVKEAA